MGVIQRQGTKQSIVKLAGVFIGFVSLIFIYPMDHESYGYAQFLFSYASLLVPLVGWGLSQSTVKFFAPYSNKYSNSGGFIWIILLLHIIPAIVFISLLYLFRGSFYHMIDLIGMNVESFQKNETYIILITYLLSLTSTLTYYISNYQRIVVPSIINEFGYKIFLPGVILLIVLGYIDYNYIAPSIFAFFMFVVVSLFIYSYKLDIISAKPQLSFLSTDNLKYIAKYSLYSALGSIGAMLAFRLDAIMVTGLLSETSNGLYFNILVMAAVIDIPTQAINKIAGPIISKSWTKDDKVEISNIYTKASINSLIFGLLIFMGIWFNLDYIISLTPKPEAFIGASTIFLFIGLAKVVDGLTSINTHIIIYSKWYRFNLLFLLFLGVLNIGLNYLLINLYGVIGAALATFISLSIYNLIKYIFIKSQMKMQPFSLDTCKVILVAFIVFFIVTIVPMPNIPIVNIIIRSLLISFLFIPMIYFLKVSLDLNSMLDKYLKIITSKIN